jgi:hypothetical protein
MIIIDYAVGQLLAGRFIFYKMLPNLSSMAYKAACRELEYIGFRINGKKRWKI